MPARSSGRTSTSRYWPVYTQQDERRNKKSAGAGDGWRPPTASGYAPTAATWRQGDAGLVGESLHGPPVRFLDSGSTTQVLPLPMPTT
jgi:hypothetical protein